MHASKLNHPIGPRAVGFNAQHVSLACQGLVARLCSAQGLGGSQPQDRTITTGTRQWSWGLFNLYLKFLANRSRDALSNMLQWHRGRISVSCGKYLARRRLPPGGDIQTTSAKSVLRPIEIRSDNWHVSNGNWGLQVRESFQDKTPTDTF